MAHSPLIVARGYYFMNKKGSKWNFDSFKQQNCQQYLKRQATRTEPVLKGELPQFLGGDDDG